MHPHTSSTSKLHSKALAATTKSCLLTWVQWPQQFSIRPMGSNPAALCLKLSPLEHQHHTTAVQYCLKANKQAPIWWSVCFILIPMLVGFCRKCQAFPGLSTSRTLFQPDRKRTVQGLRSQVVLCKMAMARATHLHKSWVTLNLSTGAQHKSN